MSRARSITYGGRTHWFDTSLDGQPAQAEQLELLIDATGVDLDEILDSDLTQGQVKLALHEALHGEVVPPEVLERKRQRKTAQRLRPPCRICGVEGKSTKHHFIPRWIMRELENYQTYAPRSICTIPLCVDCHRDLHDRTTDVPGKSIVSYLKPREAALAQRILDDLKEQRPGIFDLIAAGNEYTYEYVLVKDYRAGEFTRLARGVTEEAGSLMAEAVSS
jgi:hypothetical protein